MIKEDIHGPSPSPFHKTLILKIVILENYKLPWKITDIYSHLHTRNRTMEAQRD